MVQPHLQLLDEMLAVTLLLL